MPPRQSRKRQNRPPTPPPPPQPEVESEEEEVQLDGGETRAITSGYYLDVSDLGPIEGNPLLENLQYLEWLNFVKYRGVYYQNAIYQFYINMGDVVYDLDDNNPSIPFDINGTRGEISAYDFSEFFGMPCTYLEQDLSVLDYPKRGWGNNWPLEYEECVDQLNNGRVGIRHGHASKLNLTGYQRLAFKLVLETLLPANNKATEITYVQAFVVNAIMRKERINLPSLIIAHMIHSKDKGILPYGMVLSYMLQRKGVNFGIEIPMEVAPNARINRKALRGQEIYVWQGVWWSKWEVYEYFEGDLEKIWKANGVTKPPRIPMNWERCGISRGPPNPELLRGEEEGAGSSHQAATPRTRMVPPTRVTTEQERLAAIEAQMNAMHLEQQRQAVGIDQLLSWRSSFDQSYMDYQWRQTAMFQAMSTHMGLQDTYNGIFAGFPTAAPHQPPQDPMESDDPLGGEGGEN